MTREWIVFLVSVVLFLLLWPALSKPSASSCVWLDHAYTVTHSEEPGEGTAPDCIPEAKIRDQGCDPRYQDCAGAPFYRNTSPVPVETLSRTPSAYGVRWVMMSPAAATWERNYEQFRPWRGKHRPVLWGERGLWGNLWTTPIRIVAGWLP